MSELKLGRMSTKEIADWIKTKKHNIMLSSIVKGQI
jgi:hypothetical protein